MGTDERISVYSSQTILVHLPCSVYFKKGGVASACTAADAAPEDLDGVRGPNSFELEGFFGEAFEDPPSENTR